MTDLEAVAEKIAAGVVAGLVGALQQAGANPQQSIRLAAFVLLEDAFGSEEAWEVLNLPRATAYRWRAEAKRLNVESIAEEPPAEFLRFVEEAQHDA